MSNSGVRLSERNLFKINNQIFIGIPINAINCPICQNICNSPLKILSCCGQSIGSDCFSRALASNTAMRMPTRCVACRRNYTACRVCHAVQPKAVDCGPIVHILNNARLEAIALEATDLPEGEVYNGAPTPPTLYACPDSACNKTFENYGALACHAALHVFKNSSASIKFLHKYVIEIRSLLAPNSNVTLESIQDYSLLLKAAATYCKKLISKSDGYYTSMANQITYMSENSSAIPLAFVQRPNVPNTVYIPTPEDGQAWDEWKDQVLHENDQILNAENPPLFFVDTARDTSLLDRDTPSLDGYDENIEPEFSSNTIQATVYRNNRQRRQIHFYQPIGPPPTGRNRQVPYWQRRYYEDPRQSRG